MLAVLPPICEELLCRGFLLSSFKARMGTPRAVLLSALLFGALHLDVHRFPATFAAGLMLGYVCVRTGSVFTAILFHMLYNGLVATGQMVPTLGGSFLAIGPAEIALALAGLAACIVLLERHARRN